MFFWFTVMETTCAASWSDMTQPCDMELWVRNWRSVWPLFHGPVILSYILKTIWCMYMILSDYNPTFDVKVNVGHCDLYFMVQWLCLIPWRLFHVWTSSFGIMNQYDPMHDFKINVGHWPIFHGPVILCYILKTIWCMNIILGDYVSVSPDVWPQNKCMSLWPIFHGPLILPYISKTIWWMSVIFSDEKVWPKPLPQNIGQHDLYFMV